eukprot:TRINITY_DN698_c0_g1_i5.p1 TRINITY_DN698_c0_g1~~TRINITY_DN698_c0_g1_i5.p1  ORF type:complete len:1131 (+),score=233.03 TRINITY_DN698_c0_g1_i5:80-3472(+)
MELSGNLTEQTPLVSRQRHDSPRPWEKWCGTQIPPPPPIRKVYANDSEQNRRWLYASNETKTTKYTPYNFVFKNLFEQFRRASNFYFLIVILIQLIPTVSPIFPITSILPLAFVLSITAIREGYEDYKRSIADKEVNQRMTYVVENGFLASKQYQDVQVGDILYIEKNTEIAADAVLLASSTPDGVCFIETSNLDGESNLKPRTSPRATYNCNDHQSVSRLRLHIECEKPNINLYSFQATLHSTPSSECAYNPEPQVMGLSSDQLLLRGSSLRNTSFVYALVVYTGPETKIILNQQDVPSKFSYVEKQLNNTLVWILVVQLVLCLLASIAAMVWRIKYADDAIYLESDLDGILEEIRQTVLDFFTFFVLLNYMIPISLYVTAEMCKVIMAYFMSCDIDMYDEASQEPAIIKTSNLLDELGQVQYVFSDKTGTLTENIMKFRKCSILGDRFYLPDADEEKPMRKSSSLSQKLETRDITASYVFHSTAGQSILDVHNWMKQERAHAFWLVLSLCHTVNVEVENGSIVYQASSSDEEALVCAAASAGYVLKKRSPGVLELEIQGHAMTYQVLEICHFDSVRKRMSVVVQSSDGRYYALVKGADSSMLKILSQESKADEVLMKASLEHLEEFSREGLRTLCVGFSELSKAAATEWLREMQQARNSMEARESKLALSYRKLEKDIHLIGVTAIEDRLQEGVPETIAQLSKANIKVWVLTGDKQETAINIGYSCNILKREGITYIVKGDNPVAVEEKLTRLRRFMDDKGYTDRDLSQSNSFSWKNCWPQIDSEQASYDYTDMDSQRMVADAAWGASSSEKKQEHVGSPVLRMFVRGESQTTFSGSYLQAQDLVRSGEGSKLDNIPTLIKSDSYAALSDQDSLLEESFAQKSDALVSAGDPTNYCHQDLKKTADSLLSSSTQSITSSKHLPTLGLVIDGESITHALEYHKDLFLDVAQRCHSVICCRMSPLQKALVVRTVQDSEKKPICLAIGDGGNDVSMIQEAKVGVGIIGREGRQAVRASDYSIAQFMYLRKLLFVHGRWCYRRMSVLIQYSYYKNMAFILPTLYFAFFSGFTGQPVIDSYVMMFYNIFYTSLPIFLLAVFEQDLSKEILLQKPELYIWVQSRSDFCARVSSPS